MRNVVDGDRGPGLGQVDDHHSFPAEPARIRLRDAHGEGRRDRRVHGVSPVFEDLDSRLRGQRMSGRDHAVGGLDLDVFRFGLGWNQKGNGEGRE